MRRLVIPADADGGRNIDAPALIPAAPDAAPPDGSAEPPAAARRWYLVAAATTAAWASTGDWRGRDGAAAAARPCRAPSSTDPAEPPLPIAGRATSPEPSGLVQADGTPPLVAVAAPPPPPEAR